MIIGLQCVALWVLWMIMGIVYQWAYKHMTIIFVGVISHKADTLTRIK